MTEPLAERVRKIGGTTLRSIGYIGRLQRVLDNARNTSRRRTCFPNCATTTSN
jgi:hypothetical protein